MNPADILCVGLPAVRWTVQASDICPLTNGDATTGFECDSAQEHIVEIFVIGKNSPQLAGYDEVLRDCSLSCGHTSTHTLTCSLQVFPASVSD